jgi:hypothetical protein
MKKPKRPYINDGRAPDTNKTLRLPVIDVVQKKKPGRPKGSTTIVKDSSRAFLSYSHLNNTCYLTSLLESMFMTWSSLVTSGAAVLPGGDCVGSKLFAHFWERYNITPKPGELINLAKLKKCLETGQQVLVNFIISECKLYGEGEYGNPMESLRVLVVNSGGDFIRMMSLELRTVSMCAAGHLLIHDKYHCPLLIMDPMDNNCSSKNVAEVLSFMMGNQKSGKCRQKGCILNAVYKVSVGNHPKILVLQTGCPDLIYPDVLHLDNKHYALISRIFSTSESGTHFYTLSKSYLPKRHGIYLYDDLRNGNHSRIVESHQDMLKGHCPLSQYVFYALM